MSPDVDEKFVKQILGDAIRDDGGLTRDDQYVGLNPGDDYVSLDGHFTSSYLRALCYYMDHMQ